LKNSFAMLFAIIFLVILGTLGALMMNFSSLSLKQTSDLYLGLEEKLKAKSATEYAIMALESRDFTKDGCINKIDINGTIFDVNMTFHYFLTECPSDCNCSTISTKESNGTVLINTYVNSKVMPHIRYFRQTIQKP
jgi:hypothetical protein